MEYDHETTGNDHDTISKTYSYDTATAFMTQQTAAGVTTTFAPDARGNPGTRTDALGHSTIVTYEWGVESTTQTPEYTIGRTINLDGTVASETRGGHTTTFGYDAAVAPQR